MGTFYLKIIRSSWDPRYILQTYFQTVTYSAQILMFQLMICKL